MRHLVTIFTAVFMVTLFVQCGENVNEETDYATEQSYTIAEQHAKVWDQAREQVIELVDRMPEDKLNYRPHDSLRTFSEQIVHIAQSSVTISTMFLKGEKMDGPPQELDASSMTKDELKELVDENLTTVREIIMTMSNDELMNGTTKSFSGNEMSKLEGMMFVHDHLTNHKAKANMYIRVSGSEPPSYRYY